MKKVIVIAIFVATNISISVFADSSLPTGSDWLSWDSTRKMYYVEGFRSGVATAVLGYVMYLGKNGLIPPPNSEKDKLEALVKYMAVFKGISLGQIMDGIGAIYSDHSNREITVDLAIYVALKKIRGSSRSEVEDILSWLRSKRGKGLPPDFP